MINKKDNRKQHEGADASHDAYARLIAQARLANVKARSESAPPFFAKRVAARAFAAHRAAGVDIVSLWDRVGWRALAVACFLAGGALMVAGSDLAVLISSSNDVGLMESAVLFLLSPGPGIESL